MFVFIVTVGAAHARPWARAAGPGREGLRAWWGEKPSDGVEADEGRQRFGEAQPLARPPGLRRWER